MVSKGLKSSAREPGVGSATPDRRRPSLADQLVDRIDGLKKKTGIKRHHGSYKLDDRCHARIVKPTGYHGNHWDVRCQNLEGFTRRMTLHSIDEAVMKQRDDLVKEEKQKKNAIVDRLRNLNQEFLEVVSASRRRHGERVMSEKLRTVDRYQMCLDELNHFNQSSNVEEQTELERQRRIGEMAYMQSDNLSQQMKKHVQEMAAANERMNEVRAAITGACKRVKDEIQEIEADETEVAYDAKDRLMRELVWKMKQKTVEAQITVSQREMEAEHMLLFTDKNKTVMHQNHKLLMKELVVSFVTCEKVEIIEKEKKELAFVRHKDKVMEELSYRLNRCNAAKACAEEKARRIKLEEGERMKPPNFEMRELMRKVHQEMVLEIFNGRILQCPESEAKTTTGALSEQHKKLVQIRNRARLKSYVVPGFPEGKPPKSTKDEFCKCH